jgi:pyruvate dehydrogenase E1 component
MVPFYIFYSMFGFQRTGDFAWAFADARGRGFMLGATAGRTTLNGEGLQHEDGHSHVLASVIPNLLAYDPAWAFETAVIVREGLERMYGRGEDVFYYLTLYNEDYPMAPMPTGVEQGILRGLYRFREGEQRAKRAQLFGSGVILREALRAQELLAKEHGVAADVWSVTSYQQLRNEALTVERWNRLHPLEAPRVPYVTATLGDAPGPVIAASDFMKSVPDMVARWVPRSFTPLGTDGFGRSDTRASLRRHFETDAEHIALAALTALARAGKFDAQKLPGAIKDLGVDPEAPNPATA